MSFYWEPASTQRQSKSNGTKIIALVIILMIIVSTGIALIVNFIPNSIGPTEPVRVAVLDSGIDSDLSLQGRIVAQQSFITLQNGYEIVDSSVTDSRPDDVPHGTLIAKQIAQAPNSLILNGKILSTDGTAPTVALVEAIHWAVEQNASVINLSLGGVPTLGDPSETAIDWAFSQGVIVIVSAGNSGDSGLAGTSIESPAVYKNCLAVGALTDNNEPAFFSSTGPANGHYVKPDISALGYTTGSDGTRYYGTSFAAPRVSAAAAELVGYSMANNITWSPGSIMTALMKGSTVLSDYQPYEVGAGKLSIQGALNLIKQSVSTNELPPISYAFPGILPIDYERLFQGDTYHFNIRLFTSGTTVFITEVYSTNTSLFIIDDEIEVNQIALVPVAVDVPNSGVEEIAGTITFTSEDFGNTSVFISFPVGIPNARVAFDISHTAWDIDTIYGQFREFYKELVNNNISVTEIRNSTATTLTVLQEFDAIVLLDPCAYSINDTDPERSTYFSLPFSESEKQAYEDYYDAGGGLFVVGLSNSTLNVSALNEFLSWTGFSFTEDEVPTGDTPTIIDTIDSHPITNGVNRFDYLGATIQIPGDGHRLARYVGMPVLGYKEGAGGGKIVVIGSNFMLDNWGLLDEYSTINDNARLVLQIVLWCAGKL
ncbi:MAG: S8 family serine peptidase [Candidatus Thorarchaeota archaeon]|nr:S8 family serine peptidase [Candidatus Thorarchaeota archaeon]